VVIDESKKKYKLKLSDNQKFRKCGEITYIDETCTVREAIASSLLAGAPPMLIAHVR
jgi:hypothetical protein